MTDNDMTYIQNTFSKYFDNIEVDDFYTRDTSCALIIFDVLFRITHDNNRWFVELDYLIDQNNASSGWCSTLDDALEKCIEDLCKCAASIFKITRAYYKQ